MPWSLSRTLLLLLACAVLAALLNVPLFLSGTTVNWNDYSATLLSRIAVAREFVDFGWCRRFSLMLAGVNAAENGLDPKLDTLLFATLDPVKATLAFYLIRDFALLAGLSTILVTHYRVPLMISVAAAALACEGFNVLNWYFFGYDYFGPVFLFGYAFFPLLVLPALLVREQPTRRRQVLIFALSATVGVLYSLSTVFAFVVFTLPLAVLWIAHMVPSRAMLWPIAGVVIGAGLAALPGLVSFLQHEESVRHTLRESSELSSAWEGLRYLLLRAPKLTAVGGIMMLAAAVTAVLGRRAQDFGVLLALYLLALLPDVIVKSVLAPASALPPMLLSVNYYSYFVAPIFLAAALAVGFSALPKLELRIVSLALLVLAGHMAVGKVAAEMGRPGLPLSAIFDDPALDAVVRLNRETHQRAVMITSDVASLTHFHFRIPRPIPAYVYARGAMTSDGFASSMGSDYAMLWSSIMQAKDAPDLPAPNVFRQAYLELDVRDVLAEGADGCFSQTKKVALSALNIDLLALTAARFVVSFVDVDDPRLRLVQARAPGPIVCGDHRLAGGFNVYELASASERVSLARSVAVLENDRGVLARMRRSTAAKDGKTAFLARADAKTISPRNLNGSGGTVTFVEDTPDRVVVRVEASAPTLLIVRDSFAAAARASIGGKPVPVVRANYAYMGIPVARGTSVVEIRY